MSVSVLVMSCDAYSDVWQPFYVLYNKYWQPPYKTYICSETIACDYFTTIKTQGSWTKRVREALEQIDSEYIIFMLEDYFIRDYVDQDRINKILANFKDDEAVYDFEEYCNDEIEKEHILGFGKRKDKTIYMNNTQPSIHNRLKLIERLQVDQDPWEWETTIVSSPYKFYINMTKQIIDTGYYNRNWMGLRKGKWCREIVPFFAKENIEIDYEKRGFYND